MEKVHSTLAAANGLRLGYALANEKFPNNSKVTFRGHFGDGEGFKSLVLYNREYKIGYALSNNSSQGMWNVSQLIEAYLTNNLPLPTKLKTSPLEKSAAPYLGYYQFVNPRSSKWNIFQKIMGGFHLKQAGDKLVVKRLIGQPDTLYRVKDMLFKRADDLEPYYVFGKDATGNLFFQGLNSEFYQKTTYLSVLLQQLFLVLTGVSFLLTILIGLSTLVLLLLRKSKPIFMGPALLPVLALTSGFTARRVLVGADDTNKLIFNDVNALSIVIFLGSLGFALFIFWAAFLLYRNWNSFQNKWVRGILSFNLAILCCFTLYLSLHGWIGVRVWAL
ncbi:MAG: hypothetical protein EOO61_11870 [Hymenobacter sp.]|nr:MAG: hypothetical protein EOO61_11870 [Hymenobacter sp.]